MWRLAAISFLICQVVLAEPSLKSLQVCAELADAEKRLLCYDEFYDDVITEISPEAPLHENSPTASENPKIKPTANRRYTNETRWINALKEEVEESREDDRFLILPYRTNYVLIFTYDSHPNSQPYALESTLGNGDSAELDNEESKIQISLKSQLAKQPFGRNSSLWVAYTQLSMWQVYNSRLSSPFREINYETEAYLQFIDPFKYFGLSNTVSTLGLNHQSNGRSEPTSRSWNRVVGSLYWGEQDYVVGMQAWWRIPESESDDDNPDIHKYLGYGKLFSSRKYGRNTWSITLTNNLRRDDNRGSVQLDWSFPLGFTPRLKGYLQYFNGYGETLIDYNDSVSRISLGVLLTDWL